MGHANALRGDDGMFIVKEWEVVRVVGGVSVLRNPTSPDSNALPIRSNSADYYFKQDKNGDIIQLRVYNKEHHAVADIDICPEHDHRKLKKGIAHIHTFKGDSRDSKTARYLTEDEIAKYHHILSAARPDIRYE